MRYCTALLFVFLHVAVRPSITAHIKRCVCCVYYSCMTGYREGREVIMNSLVHSVLLYCACVLLGRIATLPIATAEAGVLYRTQGKVGKTLASETRAKKRVIAVVSMGGFKQTEIRAGRPVLCKK